MKISELSNTNRNIYTHDCFGQSANVSGSPPPAAHKAAARKMRIESQSALLRIEKQIQIPEPDWELPLNEERANQMLAYFDQQLAAEKEDSMIFIYTAVKVALQIYLEQPSEVAASCQKMNELMGPDTEDEQQIEDDLGYLLMKWAAGGSMDEVWALGKEPNPLVLLLLKAKGIPFPEPIPFTPDSSGLDNELGEALYSRNYQQAIQYLDNKLNDPQLDLVERDLALQARGYCKAMLGDYEGALRDYDEVVNSGPIVNAVESRIVRGLIHYLNGDLEKAQADIWPAYKEGMRFQDLVEFLFEQGDFSGFAVAQILNIK